MSMGVPSPPDYRGAAAEQATASQQNIGQQTAANRPNINTPWAGQQWVQGPTGEWTLNTQFSPFLSGISQNVSGQAQGALSQPLDLSQFGPISTGEQAREQAINAAYQQAASRLNPMFSQRRQQLESRLAAQGLSPGSEAARNAERQLGMQENDAYTSALNAAIGQGTAAGESIFRQNLLAQQQAIANALRQRQLPLEELQQLQGFLAMPGFTSAGAAETPQYLPAAIAGGNYGLQAAEMQNRLLGSGLQGAGGLLSGLASLAFLSDERSKKNILRYSIDSIPGVPFASWEYIGLPGKRFLGVIAQDLIKVAPEYIHTRDDGMLMVDYSFLR